MSKLISFFKNEKLVTEIDHIQKSISPKNAQARGKYCIHKERAILKYKMLPVLGYSIDEEEDKLTPVSFFSQHT